MNLQNFLFHNNSFLANALKRGKYKIGVRVGGKGCEYSKDWFKLFFTVFIT
jgi:hypothetical protein